MKVLVLGANGRVGSKVVEELLARGHSVVAAIHKNSENVSSKAQTRTIDITDSTSVKSAIIGCDAVICALSSWGAPKHNILETAMRTVIPALEAAGTRRIVSISGDVARVPGEKVSLPIRIFHVVAFGPIRKVIADSEAHIRMLQESDLDWTVLRPGVMTPSFNGDYILQLTHPLRPMIPRLAVVNSLVDLVDSQNYIHEAPYISRP